VVRKSFSDSVGVGRRGVIKKGCLPCSQTPSATPQTHKSRVTMRTQVNLYGGHVVKGKSYDTIISLSSSTVQVLHYPPQTAEMFTGVFTPVP